jgi:hypothetical protein
MKLLLHVYVNDWATTEIQAAWIELNLEYINALQTLRKACENLPTAHDMTFSCLTYVDPSPYFLVPVYPGPDAEEDPDYLDRDGHAISLFDIDECIVLCDDQEFPEESPRKMTQTYLNVERTGVWWESRDDLTEDKVETALITWEQLEGFKRQLETARDGRQPTTPEEDGASGR